VLLGALAVLGGCDAERILAFGNARDASGGAGDASMDQVDGNGNPGDAAQPWTPFGPAQPVIGLRTDNDTVQGPSLTFEALELYFSSVTGGLNDIWVVRRTVATDPWGPSTLVTELASSQNDEDPEVSVDGLVMYFSSDRGGDGLRLYVSQRRTRDIPWGTPQRVDTLGSSTLDEAPGPDRSQLYLVFGSQRGAPDTNLYAAMRPDASAAWQSAVELPALNSAWQDTDPALFADGRALVFVSRRTTQGGTADLFRAARPDASSLFASPPEPIVELNTADSEEDPWISQDGRHVLFVSDRTGRRRIYEAWR
jgi:Tol biopolymer transport system component